MEVQIPLVLFSLIAGAGGCMITMLGALEFAKNSITERSRNISCIVALILIVVGGCCSLLHLESPENVMAAVTNIFSFSGISIELMLLGITFVIGLVYLIVAMRHAPHAVTLVFGILGIVSGLALAFFTGHGYLMISRAMWDTNLLPLAYLGTSLALGVFLVCMIQCFTKDEGVEAPVTKSFVLVAAVVCALSCLGYTIFVVVNGAEMSLSLVGGVIVCGIAGVVVCAIINLMKMSLGRRTVIIIIGVVVALLAALGLRVLMWELGTGFIDLFDLAVNSSYKL